MAFDIVEPKKLKPLISEAKKEQLEIIIKFLL